MSFDNKYTSEVVCPHCGNKHSDSWEYSEDEDDLICDECNLSFSMERHRTIEYCTEKITFKEKETLRIAWTLAKNQPLLSWREKDRDHPLVKFFLEEYPKFQPNWLEVEKHYQLWLLSEYYREGWTQEAEDLFIKKLKEVKS